MVNLFKKIKLNVEVKGNTELKTRENVIDKTTG